jgi:hypothetical protein
MGVSILKRVGILKNIFYVRVIVQTLGESAFHKAVVDNKVINAIVYRYSIAVEIGDQFRTVEISCT